MPEEYKSDNKVAGGPGITAGGDVSIGDVSGQVAIGEHIYQINLIYNDYSSSPKEGKIEDIPEKLRDKLNEHLAKIKEAESADMKLSTDAYYTLGRSAYYERDFDTAEHYLTKAVEDYPNNIEARNLLITIYATRSLEHLSNKRYEKVINDSEKAESYFQYRSIAGSFALMGYVYKNMYLANNEQQYLDKVKEKFEIALTLDPKNKRNVANALNGLGNYYYLTGNYDLAIDKHLEAIRIIPEYASAHHDLAAVYQKKMGESGSNMDEWRSKAIEEWKKAAFFGKDDPSFSDKDIHDIEKRISLLQQT
ncbi:MAG: tetratricopeptide repeat protein [Methanosarcinales archaeon]|nr:tetratricopeptide repeat protein [Methanosarcinales archaeon]